MKNYLLSFLMLLALAITFHSCDKNEIVSQQLDTTEFEKFVKKELPSSTFKLKSDIETRDPAPCGPTVGPNCQVFEFAHTFSLDISDCSTFVSDPCDVLSNMTVTLCVEPVNGTVNVTFEEEYIGHAASCITGPDHTDDSECLTDLIHSAAIEIFMPIVLGFYQVDNSCYGGNRTISTDYVQEVCVYPCVEELPGGWHIVRLVQCGSSTACCVSSTTWCVDENGDIQTFEAPSVVIGTCTPAIPPCQISKGDPWPMTGSECAARSCR